MKLHSTAILVKDDIKIMTNFYTTVLNLKIEADLGACQFLNNGLSLWCPSEGHPIHNTVQKKEGAALELVFETETKNSEEFDRIW